MITLNLTSLVVLTVLVTIITALATIIVFRAIKRRNSIAARLNGEHIATSTLLWDRIHSIYNLVRTRGHITTDEAKYLESLYVEFKGLGNAGNNASAKEMYMFLKNCR